MEHLADDQSLLASALTGDSDALEALLDHHTHDLEAYLRSQMDETARRTIEVQEVLDTTYLEVFRGFASFAARGDHKFLAWCKAIAMHNLQDAIRKGNRLDRGLVWLDVLHMDGSSDSSEVEVGCATTTPSRHAARNERRSHVLAAIERLPQAYRQPVRLCDIDGMTSEEAARQIGCSAGAVRMRRARGHECLRADLGSSSRFYTDTGA